MDEQYCEKLLNIKTSGEQQILNKSMHYNRYEPTSYFVLQTLTQNYKFTAEDSIVDFGCGKGRLNFYLNYFFNSTVTGIEMNAFFYNEANENKNNYLKKHKNKKNNIHFLNCFAEEYSINPCDNKFYFFNPFSIKIFRKIIKNILISIEENERTVDVILYYPCEDYVYFLENNTPFVPWKEIRLPQSYDNDPRECLLIFRIDYENLNNF